MLSPELLRESLDTVNLNVGSESGRRRWRNLRSHSHTRNRRILGTPVWAFAVRLHATGCSLRETQAILQLFGVQRSHQAIFHWVHWVADSVPYPPEFTSWGWSMYSHGSSVFKQPARGEWIGSGLPPIVSKQSRIQVGFTTWSHPLRLYV